MQRKFVITKTKYMETLVYKTNMKCSGCIEKVTPALNELAGKENWKVDLQNSDKTLTIAGDNIQGVDIQRALEMAGFKSEKI
jgi:copper chaperone CopZ